MRCVKSFSPARPRTALRACPCPAPRMRRPLVSANLVGDQPVTLREDQTVMWAVGQGGAQAANESGGTLDRTALEHLYAPTDMLYHGRANR